jgi:hypothetical protein
MVHAQVVTVIEDVLRVVRDFVRPRRITRDGCRAATDLVVAEVQPGEGSLPFDGCLETVPIEVINQAATSVLRRSETLYMSRESPVRDNLAIWTRLVQDFDQLTTHALEVPCIGVRYDLAGAGSDRSSDV